MGWGVMDEGEEGRGGHHTIVGELAITCATGGTVTVAEGGAAFPVCLAAGQDTAGGEEKNDDGCDTLHGGCLRLWIVCECITGYNRMIEDRDRMAKDG